MKHAEFLTYVQSPMTVVMVVSYVVLTEHVEIPIYLQGPIATIIIVVFSIVLRLGLFWTTTRGRNSGPDFPFCAVGLQLAFFYRKIEHTTPPMPSHIGWDPIFLICFLTVWVISLILVREAPSAKMRLRYINPYSVFAGILGFASILFQIYWRLLCHL